MSPTWTMMATVRRSIPERTPGVDLGHQPTMGLAGGAEFLVAFLKDALQVEYPLAEVVDSPWASAVSSRLKPLHSAVWTPCSSDRRASRSLMRRCRRQPRCL